jgi:glutamine synthetase
MAIIAIRNVLVIDATRLEGRPSAAPRCTYPHSRLCKEPRGVKNWKEAAAWLEYRGIEDIECITPDQAGVARGKMMPSNKFTSNTSLALPSAPFMMTISGQYPENGNGFQYPEDDGDLKLVPDLSTLCAVPWESDATAQVICDLVHQDGRRVGFTPRNVLRRVLAAYEARGLKAVVAPEIEFYLVRKNPDPDYPLSPPVGRSGRPIAGGSGYSIAGVNEYDELIDDIYHFSEAQGLEIDTLIHEEGAGQLEINLRHGDPIELADQVFLFKRTIREAAMKHDVYATFMAKPIQGQPGSAMHIHQSIIDKQDRQERLHQRRGRGETDAFFHFIGGMQNHVPNALVMFAPYVNSYRRLTQAASAPVNNKWGYDNRTTAFPRAAFGPGGAARRKPHPFLRRQPYLALAGSLACGLLGMTKEKCEADPVLTTANEDEIDLPRGLLEAVDLFEKDEALRRNSRQSVRRHLFVAIKRAEFETFMEVISPWEREFLLLNV